MSAPGAEMVTILNQQPLFSKLAGKGFPNTGKSVDYSGYNFADKCLTLESIAPDTQAIARYNDGSIAVGMRRVGKGRVIVLGSPFWRDSYDKYGQWWPGDRQSDFLQDLLSNLGVEPLATSENRSVWREHYTANNGTEEFLVLWNPTDAPQNFSTDWTTIHPATTLYDPKNGQTIAAKIEGNTVHLENLTLAPLETLMVATQPQRPAADAIRDWFGHLTLWEHASAPGKIVPRPDLPLYDVMMRGPVTSRVAAPDELKKLDLAALSQGAPTDEKWSDTLGLVPPQRVGVTVDAQSSIVYRMPLQLPDEWKAGDDYRLVFREYQGACPTEAYLNGQRLSEMEAGGTSIGIGGMGASVRGVPLPISSALKFDGPNVLVFVVPSAGYSGEIGISRRPHPTATLDVSGAWQVQSTEDSGYKSASLPGTFNGMFAQKSDVLIPASWKGSRVFIEIAAPNAKDAGNHGGFAINERVIFLPLVAYMPPVNYMDITPWVKFGQPNRLTLLPTTMLKKWEPSELKIARITLQRVPPQTALQQSRAQ